ncbi:hypothetical protein [Mycoplasma wenyonii]|uniref:hypothetical protein n=1 Tax=Mycoplasma wenyonii TaxID=65123 RepID=UPI0005C476CB|nr:hypothetical protein [Mycoplasma wenyonii]
MPFWIFTGFGVTGTVTPVSYVVGTSPFFKTIWQRSVSLTKPVFKCTGGGETGGQDNNTSYGFYLYVFDEEGSGADKKEKIWLKVVNEKTGKTLSKSKTKFTVESTTSQETSKSSSMLVIPTSNSGNLIKMIKCSDFLWTSTSGGSGIANTYIQTSKDEDLFTKQEDSFCKRRLGLKECEIILKSESQLKWNENKAPKVIYSAF